MIIIISILVNTVPDPILKIDSLKLILSPNIQIAAKGQK